MADQVPIRAGLSGASLTGLAIFASGETIGVAHGGTGIVTIGSNQLVTGNGTSAITSESNLTFDGSTLATTAFTATGNVSLDGGTFIFNESGADKDFRVEGDTDANLFIADASTDRIGIGTATPSHLVDIEGVGHAATCFVSADLCATTKVVAPALCIGSQYVLPTADGSAGQLMCTDGSGALAFATAASAGISWDGSTANGVATFKDADEATVESNLTFDGTTLNVVGNAGVGIARTEGTLHVHTATAGSVTANTAADDLVIEGSASQVGMSFLSTNSAKAFILFGDPDATNSGQISYDHSDNGLRFYTAATERVTIDSAGKVGIGTASMSQKLDVRDDSNGLAVVTICNAATCGRGFQIDAGCGNPSHYIVSVKNNPGTALLQFTGDGKLGIGTAAPARQLDVLTTTDISGIRAVNTNGSFTNTTFDSSIARASSTAYAFIYGHNNSQADVQFNIRGDGNALLDETWQDNSLDYAEYFENTGPAIEIGVTVVLDDGKVRAYDASTDSADNIIGVNRPKSKVSGPTSHGSQWNKWHNKYLVDDYGRHIFVETTTWAWEHRDAVLYEDGDELPEGTEIGDIKTPVREAGLAYEQYEFIKDSTWTPPADATSSTDTIRKMNPDYDHSVTYESREERDEWSLIGLVGQVPMKKGETTNSRWIKMGDISDTVERWMIR